AEARQAVGEHTCGDSPAHARGRRRLCARVRRGLCRAHAKRPARRPGAGDTAGTGPCSSWALTGAARSWHYRTPIVGGATKLVVGATKAQSVAVTKSTSSSTRPSRL